MSCLSHTYDVNNVPNKVVHTMLYVYSVNKAIGSKEHELYKPEYAGNAENVYLYTIPECTVFHSPGLSICIALNKWTIHFKIPS